MKSWTRTLNLDDSHSLLALAESGVPLDVWTQRCHASLPNLSLGRRRELIRLLRDGFLSWTKDKLLTDSLFFSCYAGAPATAQIELLQLHWALSHPITLAFTQTLLTEALGRPSRGISLAEVDDAVRGLLSTSSEESMRKTRTVLLNALEGIGTLITSGTGLHRTLWAAQAAPHPLVFGYLILRDLEESGEASMMAIEAVESSLATRLTCCDLQHARTCLEWNIESEILYRRNDEVGAGPNASSDSTR